MIKRAQSAQPLNLSNSKFQQNQKDFSYEDMFKVATRQTSAFGIDGYEPPQKYVDPIKQVKEREYSTQKKGQKNKNYVTRRGHYLEDLKKQTDGIPAANKYDVTIRWKSAKPDTKRPQTAAPKRTTFIDDIFKEAKLRKVPGSGAYNVQKPLEEVLKQVEEMKKKKISQVLFYYISLKTSESDRPERPTYLNDIMHLAVINPGPGNYNPRPVSTKLKINETEPKDMIAKHKGKDKLVKSKLPDMGTYKPEALEFTTFNKIQSQKKIMADKSKFGTLPKDPRFKDPKQSKSKQKLAPGPGQYALIVNWQGKEEGLKKQTKKSYMDTTTKGVQRSIYY